MGRAAFVAWLAACLLAGCSRGWTAEVVDVAPRSTTHPNLSPSLDRGVWVWHDTNMETTTNPHHQAELASEDRCEDLWEEHLQAGTCPDEETWDEITERIFAEELEARGLTTGTWLEWIRG